MALQNAMRVIDGNVQGAYASQAKNVSYGNGTVEDALDDVTSAVDISSVVTISTGYSNSCTCYKVGKVVIFSLNIIGSVASAQTWTKVGAISNYISKLDNYRVVAVTNTGVTGMARIKSDGDIEVNFPSSFSNLGIIAQFVWAV